MNPPQGGPRPMVLPFLRQVRVAIHAYFLRQVASQIASIPFIAQRTAMLKENVFSMNGPSFLHPAMNGARPQGDCGA